MRDAFVAELYEIASRDPRVVLLSGDIGYGVFDKFRADFPDRWINMGIAEQNMIGVAAGMALEGKRPIVYTIVPFAVMRPFEQIRVDVCMQNLPVTIVGVGGGLAYGPLGPTHHSIEDVAIMRALPNMKVLVPSDPMEVRFLLEDTITNYSEPTYIRLGKNGEPFLPYPILRDATNIDVVILSYGAITSVSIATAELLEERNIRAHSFRVLCLKPFSLEHLRKIILHADLVVTIEEHSIVGGLGSAVAEFLSEVRGPPLLRFGIPDKFVEMVGSREYLLGELGLTPPAIAQRIDEEWHS